MAKYQVECGAFVEYQERMLYGNSRYRGNTSGGIIRDFLEFAHHSQNGVIRRPNAGGWN